MRLDSIGLRGGFKGFIRCDYETFIYPDSNNICKRQRWVIGNSEGVGSEVLGGGGDKW